MEQEKWNDLKPAERSSRQSRGDGEVRMLQQALNFQEAHNDDLQTPAFGDGVWVMFDYSRGYAPDLETSGVMDVFRLPKFSYWFFRSQRDADEMIAGKKIGPLVFIASDWTANSPTDVRVFSNCGEVALYLNGKLVERRRPEISRISNHLKHPPFDFHLPQFQAGTLKAVGFIGGRAVAEDERRTPAEAAQLTLQFDLSGQPFAARGKDVIFCHANLNDNNGTPVQWNGVPVSFGATGRLKLVDKLSAATEAGTATTLVDGDETNATGAIYAVCVMTGPEQTRIFYAAASPDGRSAPAGQIHYTTDGSEPSLASPVYSKPLADPPHLRAAIFVQGKIAAITGD